MLGYCSHKEGKEGRKEGGKSRERKGRGGKGENGEKGRTLEFTVHGDDTGGILVDSDTTMSTASSVERLHIFSNPSNQHIFHGGIITVLSINDTVQNVHQIVGFQFILELVELSRAFFKVVDVVGLVLVAEESPVGLRLV